MTDRTFERFLADHYHELFGIVCDAATAGRKGGELSLWMSAAGKAVRARLRAIFDDLARDEKPASNPAIPTRKVGV